MKKMSRHKGYKLCSSATPEGTVTIYREKNYNNLSIKVGRMRKAHSFISFEEFLALHKDVLTN